MDVTPLTPDGFQLIESYGQGQFRVAGDLWRQAIIVMPEQTAKWSVQSVAELTVESLSPVYNAEPAIEILLIGCGDRMVMVSSTFKKQCRAKGFGVDTMDTGAACRTYNVLMAEGRRVAAALLPLRA
ncbi:Mth938-like domain-containing protein [Alphaproteobacteria bacterium]|nr:Mth938-like domain-containing protein [Alphaproteobacteria bacterium]